jgi:hypothetical protein
MIPTMPGLFRANAGEVVEKYFRWLLADGSSFAEINAQTSGGPMRLSLSHGDLPMPSDAYMLASRYGEYQLGWWQRFKQQFKTRVISVQHRAPDKLVPSFADAVRSPASEDLMERLLKKVDSRIRTVRLDYAEKVPSISVDIGLSERVPLSQAGQGIYRMVAILSELLGQKPHVCLIDEIENGLHHTVLKQVWRGIAEISSTLGIQMFVTTHSRECLEAASQVFFDEDQNGEKDFAVIQLMRVKDQVIGKVLNESRVDAAIENDIELR